MAQKKIQGVGLEEKDTGEYQMGQKDLNKVYDGLGVTKEVRDAVQKADETIMDEALQVAGEAVVENKNEIDRSRVTLGTGDRKLTVTVDGKREMSNINPQTGERIQKTAYGYASVRQHRQFPKSLREERLRKIQEDCEKAFS